MLVRSVALIALITVLTSCRSGEADGTVPTTLPPLPTASTTTPATLLDVESATSTTTSTTPTTTTSLPLQGLTLEQVASGFDQAVWVGVDPASGELLVIERGGRIISIERGVLLDIEPRVGSGGSEQGLLGLAFHPDDPDRFYLNYTDTDGDTVISEFLRVDGVMDPGSERVLLQVDQPAGNHNGGNLAFGPDGMLYIGLGDGGASNDRFNNGQDPFTLLGSMLRLDPTPSADLPYTVPADNPMPAGAGDPLVYAFGLRNPWRYAFDGDLLYVADVGQGKWEEVSVVGAANSVVENLGWPVLEGSECFTSPDCDRSAGIPSGGSMVEPHVEYPHSQGCSITGGVVMHDPTIPELDGFYLYGDFCSGFIRGFFAGDAGVSEEAELLTDVGPISSFGVDTDGRVLVVTLSGAVFRIAPVR